MKYLRIMLSLLLISSLVSCKDKDKVWEIKELDKNTIDNISVFSKTYGYIRYFYPNNNLKDIDWYKFLVYGVSEIESISSDELLMEKLHDLFSPLCPEIKFTSNSDESAQSFQIDKSVHYYINEYVGFQSFQDKKPILVKKRNENHPVVDSLYCYNLNENLYLYFPMAIAKQPKKSKEFEELKKEINKIDIELFESNLIKTILKKGDRSISFIKQYKARIADIIERRNIIRHFYPYYEEDDLNDVWDSICEKYYYDVALCNNRDEFYGSIRKCMHSVRDFHLDVYSNATIGSIRGYFKHYYPTASHRITVADSSFIMECILDSNLCVVEKINGKETDSLIKEKLKSISYSTEKAGLYKLSMTGDCLSSPIVDSIITIEAYDIISEQIIKKKLKTTDASYESSLNTTPPFIKYINNTLVFMNICHPDASYKEFLNHASSLQEATSFIMDMRGYPRDYTMSILSHFIDSIVSSGNLQEPIIYFPDQQKKEYKEVEKWHIAPADSKESDLYSKKYEYPKPDKFKLNNSNLYFLADESSVSFTETLLEIIWFYKIGKIVGDYTAGWNGDALYIDMPFGSFRMTYNKFLFRDGSQHHNIGIKPDIFIYDSDKDNNSFFIVTSSNNSHDS